MKNLMSLIFISVCWFV